LEVLIPLWRHAASASEATRSRWQWTWVGDDSVFKKYGEQLGLVGTWWSGQEHRVLSGIDGMLLIVVVGDGKLVVPVDFAIRRPDPTGPGAPCRDKLHWLQGMLDGRVAAFRRHGVALPPPMVVTDSGTGSVEWERFCHLKPFTYTICIWKISCTVIRLSRMPKATAGTSRVVKWTRRKLCTTQYTRNSLRSPVVALAYILVLRQT